MSLKSKLANATAPAKEQLLRIMPRGRYTRYAQKRNIKRSRNCFRNSRAPLMPRRGDL